MALTVEKMYAGIQAGMAKAAGMGQKMSFCIMDEGGHVKIVVQGDGARWNTVDIAIGKAYTAVSFRRGTDALFELAQKVPGFSGLETLFGGKVIMLPGGLVLMDGDQLVCGVSASGGSGEQDVECAQAVVDALKASL
ncbi:MAG: Uncharacterized conserved protein GlcG, DUF336 family [Chloroflexi bacterium]|jgi:uncharacterized protein GlcG (DUF336 family)|nr:MAG: Uncharacterized conserved protein GlcG, DUF336 family [Chloroflexota bacterium]